MSFPDDYKIVRIAGGANALIMGTIGLSRQILINTTDWTVHVLDGSTPGGIKNVSANALAGMLQSDSPAYLPKGTKEVLENSVAPIVGEIQTSLTWTAYELKRAFAKFMSVGTPSSWQILNTALPEPMRNNSKNINDLNLAVDSGMYVADPATALNLPAEIVTSNNVNVALLVIAQNNLNRMQILYDRFTSGRVFTRSVVGGVFGAWNLLGSATVITAGVINGATIGLTTPAAGKFTSLQAASINGGGFGFRNLLRNPLFRVDQRGLAGSALGSQRVVDGWVNGLSVAVSPPVVTMVRIALNREVPFALRATITSAPKAILAANDVATIHTGIEGFDFSEAGWGTSAAKPVHVFGRIKALISGNYTVAVKGTTHSYLFEVACASGQWAEFSHTIPAQTVGSWSQTYTAAAFMTVCLGAGTTYGNGVGGWQSGDKAATSSQVNMLASGGATIEIEDFRLSVNSPIPMEYVPFALELTRCQRYYEAIDYDVVFSSYGSAGSYLMNTSFFKVEKRVTPTAALSLIASNGVSGFAPNAVNKAGVTVQAICDSSGAGAYYYTYRLTADADI